MMRLRLSKIFHIFLTAALVFSVPLDTYSMQSANYAIEKDSINFGGSEESASGSYRLSDTMGEIATGQSGEKCFSLAFDNTDDYVSIPTAGASINTGTISLWMKKTDMATSGYMVATSGTQQRIYFYSGTNHVSFALGSNNTAIGTAVISSAEWHHVAGIWDNGTGSFYVDGEFISSSPYIPLTSVLNPMTVGGFGGPNQMFKGTLEDVRIYGRALSSTEITDLYNGSQVSDSTLVGRWGFDEGAGASAEDLSGNGNTGTIFGAAVFTDDTPAATCKLLNAGYREMFQTFISISSPSDVTMTPDISGITGGVGEGSATWEVLTDNPAGYQLSIRSTTEPALQAATGTFADYEPSSGNPDYAWSVSSSSSAFGFTVEGDNTVTKFLDDGNACGSGAGNGTGSCWTGFTVSDEAIAVAGRPNDPIPTPTTVKFRAEAGSQSMHVEDTYTATIVATAVAL